MTDVFVKIGWKNERFQTGFKSLEEALHFEPVQSHSLGYVIAATDSVIVLGATDYHMKDSTKRYDGISRIPVSEITEIQLLQPGDVVGAGDLIRMVE